MNEDARVLDVEVERQGEYARFLPLVKWLLAVPHLIALVFVGLGAFFVFIYAFVAVLIAGRYPEGAWNYMLGLYRWTVRVNAYLLLLTDRYPPFSMRDEAGFPRVALAYPERVERWRPLVAWLLVIPYVMVGAVINWLAGLCVVLVFFVILFTKRFPQGLFGFVAGAMRWNARAGAYGHFVATKYPPFSLE